MRLKTYIVKNTTEAIPLIKRDLGTDALILNTKKIKTGGFLGLFQKERLEVTAAVEAPSRKKPEPVQRPEPRQAAEQAAPVPQANVSSTELLDELKHIKQFMLQVIDEDRMPASLKALNKHLNQEEVTAEIQSELYSRLMLTLNERGDGTERQVKQLAREEIIRLVTAHQKQPAVKDPDIVCFIGPTGVGKTTTIAKIAADYMLKEDKRVGLITSDTYRIAAVEQLKTYASILNMPIEVVESPNDLSHALNALSDCDIILMDTAGRNYQQKNYIDDLEGLLAGKGRIQINLVLSLASKYEDMKRILANFKTIGIDELILTKKDETSSAGAILNLLVHYSIPIRYITTGQNVPDDILKATPELIADFIVGEDNHG
ncbi:flagellar biosynthesis protein FlhF [Planococcus lenghuensis]|uniref:Flagellar biosynthesis protein FlhF n=1 Tax=Planococcus lenghuensis TaxID=2213202 RepID=A0A1Q2L130_9BACL|nr:flagellar biosynthesis protein FlhF [Planococcus lenghuensis]AQQ54116.1 flagellar biosynthesis protein FlhF [Planococcus lenghuensis]